MDNISFTGINNLKVLYSSKHKGIVRITANLTDDIAGKDLSAYNDYLKKAGEGVDIYCRNKENPARIIIEHHAELDDVKNGFKLNGIPFLFDRDKFIPIFEFLGKFTQKAVKMVESDSQRELIETFNNAISTEAAKYFKIKPQYLFRNNHK